MSGNCKGVQMLTKIKKFLSRFLPLPYTRAMEQNRELCSKVALLQDIINSLDKRIFEISKQNCELASSQQQIKNGIENYKKETLSGLKALETRMLRYQPQPRLGLMEIIILDHCNLNCKGCVHFSPLAEKILYPKENIQNDLKQLSLLTDGCLTNLRIMGGEALLHPDLLEILKTARKYFPKTTINILSNGILLPTQKQEFWDICKENNIIVAVTKYPIDLDYDNIEKTANANKVKFIYFTNSKLITKTLFKIFIDLTGLQDPRQKFFNCHRANRSTNFVDGKIYPCPVAACITNFNRKFGTSLELEKGDYLDIYKTKDVKEILAFLSKPIPFCRYCKVTQSHTFPWERSKQDISEWT